MHDDELFASPRSRMVALVLGFFVGIFGAHRFYVGKAKTGVLQALTLGGFGIWWLIDMILILTGSFRDAEDRLVTSWEPEGDHLVTAGTAAAILDDVDALRAEVAELHERLDFAERLLANPDRQVSPPTHLSS
jgi:TM2 domain